MIPSVLARQLRQGVSDFLRTTFPVSTPFFDGIVDRLLASDGGVFKGPYLSIQLPFQQGKKGPDYFQDIPLTFSPYLHQEQAFVRLCDPKPRSTIVATGTGSGKTECFLLPILDHCLRHRGEPGIKAILIYPMNALATDQAKRIARTIYDNPSLRGNVTAGLYVGHKENEPQRVMSREGIITNKDTLRLKPPDILLTNYKMLDYLLIRPRDLPLWQNNAPETLRFLVVDELHTFDGAQGADLACLIRRLKARLGIKRQQDDQIRTGLEDVYVAFFNNDPKTVFLFPDDADHANYGAEGSFHFLCRACRTLASRAESGICPSCNQKGVIRVFVPDNKQVVRGEVAALHDCPYCGGHNSLTVLGSRAASLTSVMIGQLYSSPFNDDKNRSQDPGPGLSDHGPKIPL